MTPTTGTNEQPEQWVMSLADIYAEVRDAVSEAELDAAAATVGGRRLADIIRVRLTKPEGEP